MSTRGMMFFNFGKRCVARLLVSIYTLRKVYTGPITVALAKNDENNLELEKLFKQMDINVIWYEFDAKVKKHLKSALKPYLFTLSPYDTTFMFDADVIFTKPIDELWEQTEEHGFLVTHFSGWYSNGNTMTKRIGILKDTFNEKQMKAALDKHPAVNIGVLGYSKKKGDKLLRKWTSVTKDVAGRFIADEIAMQGVYFWYDHYLASGFYNYSCHFGKDFDKASIIHYHGNKHTSLERYSSRLWWGAAIEANRNFPQFNLSKWLQEDPEASKVLSKIPIDGMVQCEKEWYSYFDKVVHIESDEIIPEDPE